MRWLTLLLIGCSFFGFGACGDDDGQGPGPDAALQNDPPVFEAGWTDMPQLRQGTELLLPITVEDPDGDDFSLGFSTEHSDLEVTQLGDGTEIEISAGYGVSGIVTVTVTMEDVRGASAMAQLAVEVLPIGWLSHDTWDASGPEAREHGSLIYDEDGGRVLLFAGSGYNPYMDPLGDLWEHDLTSGTWTELTPTGDGSMIGGSQRVAQIPGQRVAYLFGGYGAGQELHGELTRVDFSGADVQLTRMTQVNPPGARALHAFVYDPVLERFLVFGGVGAALLNDTWAMTVSGDTATWEELSPLEEPSPRYGFFYGFDQVNGRLIVYSGAQGFSPLNPAEDTWILDARADPVEWTLVAEGEAEGVPPGRRNGCFVYDPDLVRLYVFGGTPDAQTSSPGLFVLDARPGRELWSKLELVDEPELRSSGFGFYDRAVQQVVMGFGNTTTAIYADFHRLGY